MTPKARCAQACRSCKKRKERCDGAQPCLLCERRGRARECHYSGDRYTTLNVDRASEEPAAKRRRSDATREYTRTEPAKVLWRTNCGWKVCFDGEFYYTGSSGTLALLGTVSESAEARLGEHDFVSKAKGAFLIEDDFVALSDKEPTDFSRYEQTAVINELIDAYTTFVRGVYDLFDDEELRSTSLYWRFSKDDISIRSAITNVVLAIGASQRGHVGDADFASTLFDEAYKVTTYAMLKPPTINLIQALMLASLYLFVNFRRNTAFTVLGSAIRAADALGLRHDDHASVPRTEDQVSRVRAWKCLRILDVSSCASLGRALATKKSDYAAEQNVVDISSVNTGLTDQVDTAGLRLCSIAESILIEVYEKQCVTIEFVRATSQRLREWAQGLPDILILDQDDSEFESRHLSEQLCLNHLTCAYYWTIILLTRPFLEHFATGKDVGGPPREESQVFLDACIHSAIRCIDATWKLTHFVDLPKKLYLINNTTLVSALVLGLASFTDAFRQYPLSSSINKAQAYLSRSPANDRQAQLYLKIVTSMISAIEAFHSSLAEQSLRQRSAQVDQLFGNVVERGKASCLQAGCAGFEYLSMTPALSEHEPPVFLESPTFSAMWDSLRSGAILPWAAE